MRLPTPEVPGPGGRTPGGGTTGVLLLTVAATVGAVGAVQWVAARTGSAWVPGGDLAVYRAAARAVLDGGSPYEVSLAGYGFAYPPFAALVFTPLPPVGPAVGFWAWTVLSALAVPAVVWLVVDHVAPHRHGPGLLAAGAAVVLPLSPVAGTLLLGNVNLLLMVLVLVDLLRPHRHRGVLVGVAAGIKLTPLVVVGYLLLTGRTRAGLTALATFLGTVGAGFLLLPGASLTFWGGAGLDGSRTRPPGEEAFGSSVRGAVLNLLPEPAHPVWLPLSALVGVAGLTVAVWASRRHEELTGLLVCVVTGLLVSPVTWYTHWVWCVPLLVLLVARRPDGGGRLAVGGLWLVFALPLPWWVVHVLGLVPLTERAWVRPVELLYTLLGAALLVGAATRLRRIGPAGDGSPAAWPRPVADAVGRR
ncbi:glycosyltransferase 87 family protein [Micromonospora echinospora]|uniref:glycosyltransferase 87 family protein n=1 Tax=Micromonospora echinospora TaxID=1877 RepID=UPI0033F497F9